MNQLSDTSKIGNTDGSKPDAMANTAAESCNEEPKVAKSSTIPLENPFDLERASFARRSASVARTEIQNGLSIAGNQLAHEICHPTLGFFSLEEIRRVNSLEDLKELYSKQGISFENNQDLFARVRDDWRQLLVALADRAEALPNSASLSYLKITDGGKNYYIYGARVEDANRGLVTNEYGRLNQYSIKNYFRYFSRETLPEETCIADHFTEGVIKGSIRQLFQSAINLFAPDRDPNSWDNKLSKVSSNLPFDASCDLPSNIELIQNMQTGHKFNIDQKQSAHLAGFLSAMKTDAILVNATHVHTIESLLNKVPSGLQKYFDKGRQEAESRNTDKEEYWHRFMRREYCGIAIKSIITAGTATAIFLLNKLLT